MLMHRRDRVVIAEHTSCIWNSDEVVDSSPQEVVLDASEDQLSEV